MLFRIVGGTYLVGHSEKVQRDPQGSTGGVVGYQVSTVYLEIRLSADRTSDWISRAASMRVLAIVVCGEVACG